MNTHMADLSASGTIKVPWPCDDVGTGRRVENEGVHGAVCGATKESSTIVVSLWTNSAVYASRYSLENVRILNNTQGIICTQFFCHTRAVSQWSKYTKTQRMFWKTVSKSRWKV